VRRQPLAVGQKEGLGDVEQRPGNHGGVTGERQPADADSVDGVPTGGVDGEVGLAGRLEQFAK
jgi:hypothetical protein